MSRCLLSALTALLSCAAVWDVGSAEPRQVHISVVDDDPTAMTFWWVTRRRTDFSEVQYGPSEASVRAGEYRVPKADRSSQWRHGIGRGARYDSPYIHEVVVDGLDYDQTYYYRVGSWEDGYSKIYSFRTRPADPNATVTFVWFGDQDVRRGAEEVVEEMLDQRTKFHFWLVVGDLSYADGDGDQWDEYGELIEPAAARFPTMFTIGNHEKDEYWRKGAGFEPYLARWRNGETDETRYWWSVNFGPMHLAHLSSEHDFDDDADQIRWLRADLEEANKPENRVLRPWIILTVHRPPYSSGAHGSDMRVRRGVEDIVREYKVQIVLAGHDHNYERILPVYDGDVTDRNRGELRDPYIYEVHNSNGPGMDPVHVVAGTGGRGTRDCRRQSFTAGDCDPTWGINVVDINRHEMTMRFIDTRGRTRDEWRMCLERDCAEGPPLPDDYVVPTNVPDPTWPPPPPYCNFHGCRNDWKEGGNWCQASERNCVTGCVGSWCSPSGELLARPGDNKTSGEEDVEPRAEEDEATGESTCFFGACDGWPAEDPWCHKAQVNCEDSCGGQWCDGDEERLNFRSALDVRGLAVPQAKVLEEFQLNDPITFQLHQLQQLDLDELSARSTAAKVSFVMLLPGTNISSLKADPNLLRSFTADYRSYIAGVAGVDEEQVAILAVSGGVLVDTLVTYLVENEDIESIAESIALLESMFQGGINADESPFGRRYGSGTVLPASVVISFANPYESPQDGEWLASSPLTPNKSRVGTVVTVVCVVAGALLVVGGAAVVGVIWHRRRAKNTDSALSALHAEVGQGSKNGVEAAPASNSPLYAA